MRSGLTFRRFLSTLGFAFTLGAATWAIAQRPSAPPSRAEAGSKPMAPQPPQLLGEPPTNDLCANAIDLGTPPASVLGNSTGGLSDGAIPCGVDVDGPFRNVWYKVTGTGGTLTATTCSVNTKIPDTEISVYCADCDNLICVDGNDDDCPIAASLSTVSWCSELGRVYMITVGGAQTNTPTGIFELSVSDDAIFCPNPIDCVIPTGACCSLGVCVETTTAGACDGDFYPGESCPGFVCPGGGCPCDDGLFCNGVETCDPNDGHCIPGTPIDCSFLNTNCSVGVCDEDTDMCVRQNFNDGTPCDDGLFCTVSDACVGGTCMGTPNPCGDGVPCTDDFCDETIDMCTHTPNNANCPDDGLFCNGMPFCDPLLGCQPGTPPCSPPLHCDEATDTCVDCLVDGDCPSDNNDCTFDQCVNNTCLHTPVPSGSPCGDDGVFCTTDLCNANGMCIHTPDNTQCPPDNDACTDTICHPTAGCINVPLNPPCDDGLFCNGVETCDPAVGCVPGAPIDCSFLNSTCNIGVCDESQDTCVRQPLPDGTSCKDGFFCTMGDHCKGGACVGVPRDCSDGNDCTDDLCDEILDMCVSTPNNANCDDGLFCNGVETCDPQHGCVPGTPVVCGDGNSCTDDICDENLDMCVSTPNDANCNDGLFCNGVETCDAQLGCLPGTPVNCSGLNDQCNVGVCDENADACVAQPVPDNQPCDDGQFCTVGEACVGGACTGGTPNGCSDGIACTHDLCDESADACTHTPDNTLCDDHNACTNDTCDSVLGCVSTDNGLCGACCNTLTGICTPNVQQPACVGPDEVWTPGVTCAQAGCTPATGACCDHSTGTCTMTPQADCTCASCTWIRDVDCSQVDCGPPSAPIPTVSSWGMTVLALVLLTLAKLRIGRAEVAA